MYFYEPTFLFRQNALKRSSVQMCDKRDKYSPYLNDNFSSSSLWLLNNDTSKDIAVTSKVCSLDRINIKSNYWKIPDTELNLTALALSDAAAACPSIAISSANSENNLFIYELDPFHHYLTHHTTISLPNIHSLCWVKNTNSRFLVSGNSKGYAHLMSVPKALPEQEEEENAEIVKRFNHRKYLRLVNKDSSRSAHKSTTVPNLGFLSSKLVTTYDDTLFLWNINDVHLAMRPKPESISVVPGMANFDAPIMDSSTLALCGSFGVSLFDTRMVQHSIPKSSLAMSRGAESIKTNLVKWHRTNEYLLASAHENGIVRLWDTRMNDTFSEISGHKGKTVTSMAWNGNDIFTGASDGMIAHWDLSSDLDPSIDLSNHVESLRHCSLKEGISSVKFDAVTNSVVESVSERQCGTLLPALNNKIVGMCLISEGDQAGLRCKILLIDGAAFLGLHAKIYDAAGTEDACGDKRYYSQEDLALIRQDASDATLTESEDKLFGPLRLHKSAKVDLHESSKHDLGFVSSLKAGHYSKNYESHDLYQEEPPCLPVVSLHSVGSSTHLQNSPAFSTASNADSVFTVSTAATFYEQEAAPKDERLFNELYEDLTKICEGYSIEVCF